MIAYLTAEFAAIILVFTYYKIRQEGNHITHLLNIPGGFLFVFLFCIVAYQLGIWVEEIPNPRDNPISPFQPFFVNIIPILLSFFGVMVALLVEVYQMKRIKQVDFLEREFRIQTLTVLGVMSVGLFTAFFYKMDYRIPIICMGLARLGMEAYSTKKHFKLKKMIAEKIGRAKNS